MPNRSYRWLLFSLAAFGFAADQATKYGMFNWLYEDGRSIGQREVIPGYFRFYVEYGSASSQNSDCMLTRWNGPLPPRVNNGALFSLGGGFKDRANMFFSIVSVFAAVGITIWGLRKGSSKDRWLCVALGL